MYFDDATRLSMKLTQVASIIAVSALCASIIVLTRQQQVSLVSEDDSSRLRLGSYCEPVVTTVDIDQPSFNLMINHWRGTVPIAWKTAPLTTSVITALNNDHA